MKASIYRLVGELRLLRTRAIQPGTKRLILTTLMFAVSSSKHDKALLAFERFRMTAAEQGRRHDQETTVDHALMRGLVTAGPVMRRGASSV